MSSSTSTGWVTVAIALPIIVFVALLILVLVLIRRRVQKRTQQLEDGAIWERGPLIMPERPVTDVATSRSQNSDESYISIRFERSETDNNPGLRSDKPDTSDPNCQSPQSPDSRSKEASDEYMSSVGHDAASAIPHLAVRIPQWPAWLPRWPSPVPSRKASSSQGHSASTRSHEPFPDLKLQPPRIVRLEPSFLHEYRPLNRHAHNESTASLIPSAAPPGTSEPPTPVLTPPPAASPPHVRHGSISRPNTPPSRTPSVPSSLLAGGRRPSAATSVSSSAVARFPQFDGDRADAQTPSGIGVAHVHPQRKPTRRNTDGVARVASMSPVQTRRSPRKLTSDTRSLDGPREPEEPEEDEGEPDVEMQDDSANSPLTGVTSRHSVPSEDTVVVTPSAGGMNKASPVGGAVAMPPVLPAVDERHASQFDGADRMEVDEDEDEDEKDDNYTGNFDDQDAEWEPDNGGEPDLGEG
ncbi:hypothetical protein EVJ58_g72 [Rhodofomes roseus]|uniref:Uncharacterized protein n=1 Tax=Rhodofomes roseus TaxID=34475 RepID=A0A4Y9Z801_9APHY|nr:hypothetical protein EVJ58_g72 [Rhodofomes roseus]